MWKCRICWNKYVYGKYLGPHPSHIPPLPPKTLSIPLICGIDAMMMMYVCEDMGMSSGALRQSTLLFGVARDKFNPKWHFYLSRIGHWLKVHAWVECWYVMNVVWRVCVCVCDSLVFVRIHLMIYFYLSSTLELAI